MSPPWTALSYSLPDHFPSDLWRPGLRVVVPLGKNRATALRTAVIMDVTPTVSLPHGVVCREIVWPLEVQPLLSEEQMVLMQDLARRQGIEVGRILGHVLPLGLRSSKVRLRYLDGGRATTLGLRHLAEAAPGARERLARAFVSGELRLLMSGEDTAAEESCLLRADPPWPVRPSATRQLAILEYLYEHGAVNRRRLVQELGQPSIAALQALVRAGHVLVSREVDGEDIELEAGQELLPPPPSSFSLDSRQKDAVQALTEALEAGSASCSLLFGVTGSGKTAVYLELARACLARGKSLLLLAPEVALAHKLRRDAASALPDVPIFFYHGYQSASRRERLWRKLAARQSPCLVVGTRSSLFLPLPSLACIVLDEEHDASFKQDEGFSYQAKEVAWSRLVQREGLLLLGSATPDLKTFYAAEQGRSSILRLPQRVGGNTLPPVELVDISGLAAGAGAEGLLAPVCQDALRETIRRGEQAIVLLNRRGYAPLMYCLGCGKTLRCPQCEIGLAYHKGREKLLCHYCGFTRPFPSPCPECRGLDFLPMGEGTERLAEQLAVLAGQPVLRLDRDSTRRLGRIEEILEAFARQEAPILVGTQMLSKGHHFPNVTLAVVADGDMGLNLPDYRAAERTFQLLLQSAGRAGRGDRPGKVLIQTRDCEHYCWGYVQTADYEGFYAEELERRRLRRYPPFVRLALLRISFAVDDGRAPSALSDLAVVLRQYARELHVQMLGPAPAPLALLRGRRRFHCLLKAEDWAPLRQLYFFAAGRREAAGLRISLDLDPINML